jgi:hypothetical protein
MKNAFATKMKKDKENAYADGVWNGLQMGLNLAAIALNHEYSFGEVRLSRLEKKVQALVDEIVDMNDPLVTKVHIETALKQIRGKEWIENG